MAAVEEFETLLKDVVSAKRLSASKMAKLTEIAMKTMEHDTQLVSILYRTHKSLPTVSKISSLYVFDALSRAARHHATKHGTTGDVNSPTGNSASFLLKVEGILEGLFEDMVTAGELKDKTKKILDIWVKGNTFPAPILTRLTEIMDGKGKEPEMKPKPLLTTDPRVAAQVPVPAPSASSASPVTPASDPQAVLLALLAQAVNSTAAPVQTIANTSQTVPGLESTQLALLQALTQANGVPQSLPTQQSVNGVAAADSKADLAKRGSEQPDSSSSFIDSTNGKYHGQLQQRSRVESYDRDVSSRGGYRGRGHGNPRGNEGHSKWDDPDRRRDTGDWSPSRRRTSRSRSPGRTGYRRDIRQHSPLRRDPRGNRSPPSRHADNTKDEFGRDIRSQSPLRNATPPTTVDPRRPSIMQNSHTETIQKPITGSTSNHDRMSLTTSVAANTSSGTPTSVSAVSSLTPASPGLEVFNPTTFDFTSPMSWEALGKMWQVTHGYVPATEELAQFVFASQAAFVDPTMQQQLSQQQHQQSWSNNNSSRGWRGSGRGRGGFGRGRGGGFVNGNSRGGYSEWGQDDGSHGTDAVVLSTNGEVTEQMMGGQDDQSHNRSGGRMQKVGEKWVFVRD